MIIGIPREIKEAEYRVAMTPEGVGCLTTEGHQVLVETAAGRAAGFADEEYGTAGARIVPDPASLYAEAEMIVKVKEFLPPEFGLFREDQILFTYIHSAIRPEQTQSLLDAKVIGIAYEDVMTDDGCFPLLEPMSEIAGEVGLLMGVQYTMTIHGGNGLLVGGAPGVPPAKIAILGAGHVGLGAARYALGLGADVSLVDVNLARLREVRQTIFPNVKTLFSSPENLRQLLPEVDILVNAVKWTPGLVLVSREMLRLMKPNALVVDIDCEPNGAIETCRFTTHENPVFVEEGIRHYCVANLPSAVARTASQSLSNATLPYTRLLAIHGWHRALLENAALRRGLGFAKGLLTFKPTAEAQGRTYTTPEDALARLSP